MRCAEKLFFITALCAGALASVIFSAPSAEAQANWRRSRADAEPIRAITRSTQTSSPSLAIDPADIRVEDVPIEKGIYIYIRKKPSMNSVLLTESSERTDHAVATYAYRTYGYHPENADERRILDGEFISTNTETEGNYIIDSTPTEDREFSSAFVLFVPYQMQFGHINTRRGAVDLDKSGVYVSLRAFAKPYADYSGAYRDNPFFIEKEIVEEPVLQLQTDPEPPIQPEYYQPLAVQTDPVEIEQRNTDPSLYSRQALDAFTDIANRSGTKPVFVSPGMPITTAMNVILNRISELSRKDSADIVVVLDTTRSMSDDIEAIRQGMVPMLKKATEGMKSFRIGLVAYKDVNEEYLTRRYDFSDNINVFGDYLGNLTVGGGGDWPEEVYTALYVAVNSFDWQAKNRLVFLIGDAPPHALPKTNVLVDDIFTNAKARRIQIYPFIVPKP